MLLSEKLRHILITVGMMSNLLYPRTGYSERHSCQCMIVYRVSVFAREA